VFGGVRSVEDDAAPRGPVVALALRVVGAGSRFLVITIFYNGVGDAVGYYMKGVLFSEFFQNLDWSPITDPQYWWDQRWWGTTPMFWFSALVVSVIGQSMLGEFVVFSLLSFLGLVGFVIAFRRSFPLAPASILTPSPLRRPRRVCGALRRRRAAARTCIR